MTRQPAQDAYRRRSNEEVLRAPTLGWNARDSLDAMPMGYAIRLDNFWPRESDVVVRNGFGAHCVTGESAVVETLASLETGATSKLLAGVNGKLINVSTATPSTVGTGFTENEWNCTQFQNRIFMANGTDAPQDWTGSTLTATAWTGPTLTNLLVPYVFKNRIYFIEKNTLKIWYGGIDAVTSTLTAFDLAGAGNFGGKLVGIGSISRDAGDGPGDYLVLFTSTGDMIVYGGTDPGASDWAIVGRYRASAPISPRCVIPYGADCLFTTSQGHMSVQRVMAQGEAMGSVSDLIRGAAALAAEQFSGNGGWGSTFYAERQMLIFNVPRSASKMDQHCMNTVTGAWSRFKGQNGYCFEVCNGALYFGGVDGTVYQADSGTTDAGAAIVCDAQLPWTYLGSPGSIKFFGMAKAIFTHSRTPAVAMGISTDFNPNVVAMSANFEIKDVAGIWDDAIWDAAIWGSAANVHANWLSIGAVGAAMSLTVRVAAEFRYEWKSNRVTYEMGGGL